MPAIAISPQRRDEILDALRRGTVPATSLDILAVGLEPFEATLRAELDAVRAARSMFKAVRGEYGSGKTFFARWSEGPAVLTLAGRGWMVNHIDWPRRRAYVEPTDLVGRSRWVGAFQPMHLELCQAIAEVFGGAESAVNLSKRAQTKLQEARADHPWVEKGSTALIRRQSEVVEWWNLAGQLLNAALAGHFRRLGMEAACGQVQVVFPANADLRAIRSAIQQLLSDAAPILAIRPAEHGLPELKFSACVPDHLLTQMLATRMDSSSELKALRAQVCRVRCPPLPVPVWPGPSL